MIICSGGAYRGVCINRERIPVALQYNAAGFHAFVLDYSVAPTGWSAACCELSKAVSYVHSIADENYIDKEKIIICGFSAGGHLCAGLGVHYNLKPVKEYSGVFNDSNRPNGMILCYPMIGDNIPKTGSNTFNSFVAGRGEEAEQYFHLNHFVTENTPKAFLWHTFGDTGANPENSMWFAAAMREKGIPFELHIFPEGPHGLALSNKQTECESFPVSYPAVAKWMELSIT